MTLRFLVGLVVGFPFAQVKKYFFARGSENEEMSVSTLCRGSENRSVFSRPIFFRVGSPPPPPPPRFLRLPDRSGEGEFRPVPSRPWRPSASWIETGGSEDSSESESEIAEAQFDSGRTGLGVDSPFFSTMVLSQQLAVLPGFLEVF